MTATPSRRSLLIGSGAVAAGAVLSGNPASLTPAHAADPYATLRARWKEMLTGGYDVDTSMPGVQTAIQQIDAEAEEHLATLVRGSGRSYLWPDLDFTRSDSDQSVHIRISYERLKALALAYATRGSAFEGDGNLLTDVIGGLDWMNANKYHDGAGGYGNWFNWQIGAPLRLNECAIMLFDHLTTEQINSYAAAVDRWRPTPDRTGANRIWTTTVVAGRAALVNDEAKLLLARDGISPMLPYVTSGDGFYEDGSFIQHHRHPYTGGYGAGLIAHLTRFLYLLGGSPWEPTDPNLENVFEWVTEAFEPWLFRGSMMSPVRGRYIARHYAQDHQAGHGVVRSIMNAAGFAPPAKAESFKSLVKHMIESDDFRDFSEIGEIWSIVRAKEITDDSSITPRGPVVGNKVFPMMDRVVHQQPEFAFAVSMSSSRIYRYESIGQQNLHGWHTGTGMHYLYNADLAQYDDGFWPTVDPYRLAGTTVPVREYSDAAGSNTLPSYHWAGGCSLGELGAAGMAFHTYDENRPDYPYPLRGRKSWFMFGDTIAALGAGIRAPGGVAAETIVENRKLGSPGEQFIVNGEVQPTDDGWYRRADHAYWAHLEGAVSGASIGYVFPPKAQVHMLREKRTHSWYEIDHNPTRPDHTPIDRNYLTMWFDHGVNPADESYAYVLLPSATVEQVRAFSREPTLEVVANQIQVQAVRAGGVLGVNVFKAGSVGEISGVTCDGPASLLVRHHGSRLDVAVSDPTQRRTEPIRLVVRRAAADVISADDRVQVEDLRPAISLIIDIDGALGSTATASFTLAAK